MLSSPFHSIAYEPFQRKPGGIFRCSIRQTDTFCLCQAKRPVRHDLVSSPQDGATVTGEREYRAVMQVWQLAGEDAQTGQ